MSSASTSDSEPDTKKSLLEECSITYGKIVESNEKYLSLYSKSKVSSDYRTVEGTKSFHEHFARKVMQYFEEHVKFVNFATNDHTSESTDTCTKDDDNDFPIVSTAFRRKAERKRMNQEDNHRIKRRKTKFDTESTVDLGAICVSGDEILNKTVL